MNDNENVVSLAERKKPEKPAPPVAFALNAHILSLLEFHIIDELTLEEVGQVVTVLFPPDPKTYTDSGEVRKIEAVNQAMRDPIAAHRLARVVAGKNCRLSCHWSASAGHFVEVTALESLVEWHSMAYGRTMAMAIVAALFKLQACRTPSASPPRGAA